jgi:hypothetical protein
MSEDFSSLYAKIVIKSPIRRIILPIVHKDAAAMLYNPVFWPK